MVRVPALARPKADPTPAARKGRAPAPELVSEASHAVQIRLATLTAEKAAPDAKPRKPRRPTRLQTRAL